MVVVMRRESRLWHCLYVVHLHLAIERRIGGKTEGECGCSGWTRSVLALSECLLDYMFPWIGRLRETDRERDRQRETLRGSYRGLQHKNRIGGDEGGREYFSFRREDLDSAGSLLFCMANPLATSTVPLRE